MAAPILVQHPNVSNTGASTFASTPVVGNTVLFGYFSTPSGGSATAAMNGNALGSVNPYFASAGLNAYAFGKIYASGDGLTAIGTDSGSPTLMRSDIWEWSGLSLNLDGTPSNTTIAANASTITLNPITTTVPNSVITIEAGFNGTNGGGYTIDSLFTITTGSNARFFSAYLIAATPGTYTPTITWTTAIRGAFNMYALQPTPVQSGQGFFGMM